MSETISFSLSIRQHAMGRSDNLWYMSWLCVPQITLNLNLLFVKRYTRNLKGNSHFVEPMSSRFNFWIKVVYFPLLLYLSAKNASLLFIPLFDLLITMPNSNFAASVHIHWSIWSRTTNSYLFVNWLPTSTLTSTNLTFVDTISLETTSKCIISKTNKNIKYSHTKILNWILN